MRKVTPCQAEGGRAGGFRTIKTASSICVRSTKPPVEGQRYLDLYVLQRDRARWGRLRDRANEMIGSIDKALARLGLPIELLDEARADRSQPAGRPSRPVRGQPQSRRRRMEKVA